MNKKQNEQFYKDLTALQAKYPECYISAWHPDDYKDRTKTKLSKNDNIAISGHLAHHFDAEYGTNWPSIDDAIECLIVES